MDLEGNQEVRIDLAVTGGGEQSFAVCLRNMYDEERVGNLGCSRCALVATDKRADENMDG